MPADQAAGLRRRQAAASSRVIHCVSDSPVAALEIARALKAQGMSPLVIDSRDRLFSTVGPHTLFDWQQQIARGQLLALPLGDVMAWHAPGSGVGSPGLMQATRPFDVSVFDCRLADMAHATPGLSEYGLLEVRPHTVQSVYALIKTRTLSGGLAGCIYGDPSSCERIRAACARFLPEPALGRITFASCEDDAIAALAVRMAHEEPGCQPRYKTGHT